MFTTWFILDIIVNNVKSLDEKTLLSAEDNMTYKDFLKISHLQQ